ncbi:MAG: YceI family protein [Saprospiraceae bacterium]|nr:YceI family protein [Saprospiraceae bacterium]
MKKLTKSAIILSLSLIGHVSMANAQPLAMNTKKLSVEKTFRINPKSVLKLDGKTNVNSFTCGCNETFQSQQLSVEPPADGSLSTDFRSAALKLKIKSLDCGNPIMNKDLQKALNAKAHPNITIELLRVEQDKCNRLTELKDWVKMKALTKISLNGHSREYWINITAKKSGPNQYRFIGTKTINMTDFCVTPPVALMGAIKVKDEIAINLDLDVSVE